jgi:hypothetical protein
MCGGVVREARGEDAPAVASLLTELGYSCLADAAAERRECLAADPASTVVVVEREVAGADGDAVEATGQGFTKLLS